MRKKKLKALIETQKDTIRKLDYTIQQKDKEIREANQWRARYEQVLLTPEYKLDAEAAFKRGEEHARSKMRNWLMLAVQNMESMEKAQNANV